jgi:ABC-2 type transport system permease protein
VAGCLLAGREILPGQGFTAAHGFELLSLAHGATLRAAVGSVLYLALIGLLALGVATIVRDSAAATGTVLGLLYLAPIVAAFVSNPVWQRRIERYGPTSAGLTIQDTAGGHSPIGPWGGLAVLAIWAAVALLTAGLLLRFRDA